MKYFTLLWMWLSGNSVNFKVHFTVHEPPASNWMAATWHQRRLPGAYSKVRMKAQDKSCYSVLWALLKSPSSIIQLTDYPSLSFLSLTLCPFRFPPSPPEETARERKKNETHSFSMFTISQFYHQSLGNTDRVSGSFSFSNKILLVYTLQLALPMRMQFKKILKELTYTFPKVINITIDINGHSLIININLCLMEPHFVH